MLRRSLLTFMLAACSHSSPQATTTPHAAAPSPCAQLADHIVSLMPGAKDAPPDKVAMVHDAFRNRCAADQWTAEAQQCFITAATLDAASACSNRLTQAQSTALSTDAGAATSQLAASNNAAAAAAPAAPAAAPAANAPPKRATRGAKTSNDPCEGGQ
jgi:hypothetical protein